MTLIVAVVTVHFILTELACVLQAGALVNVYTDGTVLVTHGGVEMGQGLHTKIAQVRPRPELVSLRQKSVPTALLRGWSNSM